MFPLSTLRPLFLAAALLAPHASFAQGGAAAAPEAAASAAPEAADPGKAGKKEAPKAAKKDAGKDAAAKDPKAASTKAPPAKETKGKDSKPMNANAVQVTMTTSMGVIKIELDKEKAPKSTENFVNYVKAGQYNKTIFHRVIDGFMIQGGGFDEKMTQKPVKTPIANEASNGLKNARGTIAMARTSDPNSATCQFFINLVNNDALNYSPMSAGYAVFGKVVEGMDVVDQIAKVKTGDQGMHSNVPVKAVVIESVTVNQ